MSRVAIIEDGVVTAIVMASSAEDVALVDDQVAVVLPEDVIVGPGWSHEEGEWLPPLPTEMSPGELEAHKVELMRMIDATAEQERLRYITPGAGQAMTYQAKMEEVRALAQDLDPDPDPDNYPLLSAEVGITASTLAEVSVLVLGAYQQWQRIGAAIERTRLGTKAAIGTAMNAEDAQAAAMAAEWPHP